MANPFAPTPKPRYVTCTITSTSPLTVTIGETTGIRGVPMKGVTYTTGSALADMPEVVGQPIILQREP